MLYDPKWEVERKTKPDTWALPTFISWLEKQPSEAGYCFTKSGHCLIAQYLKARGWPSPLVDPIAVDDDETGEHMRLPPGWNSIAYGKCSGEKNPGQTFGGALTRARAAHAEGAADS